MSRPLNRRACIESLAALGAAALPGARAWGQAPITVGVIYVGARDDYGYNQAHAQAAAQLRKIAGVHLVEEENVAETSAVQKTMAGMIAQDGATLLFPTSFGYFEPHVLALAPKNPQVRFAHCGGLWHAGNPKNAGSFFGYIDECQYLNGVVAAHMSASGKLGFVAAKPIAQVLRNINAFTLGARAVKPQATCRVIFTGDWSMAVKEAEATNSLADQGCEVLSMHVDAPKVVVETAARRGKLVCGYHTSQARLAPNAYLTGAEWHWLSAYQAVLDAAQAGRPHPNLLRGGLAAGFVRMSPYGPMVTQAARKQADDIKARMLAGSFDIFANGLRDNRGTLLVPAGQALKQGDPQLEKMNWLVEGVLGAL